MSDCNYCTYHRMKRNHPEQKYHIASHKEMQRLAEQETDRELAREFAQTFGAGVTIVNKDGEKVAWFMELPAHCCC